MKMVIFRDYILAVPSDCQEVVAGVRASGTNRIGFNGGYQVAIDQNGRELRRVAILGKFGPGRKRTGRELARAQLFFNAYCGDFRSRQVLVVEELERKLVILYEALVRAWSREREEWLIATIEQKESELVREKAKLA